MAKCAWLIGLMLLAPAAASAGTVTVRFENGFVSVSAQNAPVRDILAEWARQGQTRVVNAEKIQGGLVTLELKHVPEKQALEVLLRSVSGYVAAPRPLNIQGPSAYDRILIMATSTAAPAAGGPAMPVRPPVFVPPQAPPMADDSEDAQGMLNAPGALGGDPSEDPDDVPQAPPFPFQPGQDEQPANAEPEVPPGTVPTPVIPGPTPLPEGVVVQPNPGQIPVPPPAKPPQ